MTESESEQSMSTATNELKIIPKPNKYGGACERCTGQVPAGRGLLAKRSDGSWTCVHENPNDCVDVVDERVVDAGIDAALAAVRAAVDTPKPTTSTSFAPTDEQSACLDLFRSGESMKIEAGAGTGKTSTLQLLANDDKLRSGAYLAFNKAIVLEAKTKMPSSVYCSTVHSMAFQTVGKQYAHRLKGARMRQRELAARLDLRDFVCVTGEQTKRLSAERVASHVKKTVQRFCQTADEQLSIVHVPYLEGIDMPRDGRRTFEHNNELAQIVFPAAQALWADVREIDGVMPFAHEHYLKLWQLSHPTINADFILFDEAQDANPIMAAVIGEQTHAQRVYVGDSNQAIYEFTGAVNALAAIDADHERMLTQSFRFGNEIAAVANRVLAMLETSMRLVGTPTIASRVGTISGRSCTLTRTNACGIDTLLDAKRRELSVHFVGGGEDVADFARAARDLQSGRGTSLPELALFDDWAEVKRYVDEDDDGSDIKLMVDLVEKYGVPTILSALDGNVKESDADLVVSTAHKSKGREWEQVTIGPDFAPVQKPNEPPRELNASELRLLYVAVTRARLQLDCSSVEHVLS